MAEGGGDVGVVGLGEVEVVGRCGFANGGVEKPVPGGCMLDNRSALKARSRWMGRSGGSMLCA